MNTGLGRLADEWLSLTDKSERFRFYRDAVLPDVAARLRADIEARQSEGSMRRYGSLALILGHNEIPALITALALRPASVTVFVQPRNASGAERFERTLSVHGISPRIETVPLSADDHRENVRIMRDAVSSFGPDAGVLFDVTGGKKILSAQLGMLALAAGFDLAYLDSSDYADGGTPRPGTETIFIQSPGNHFVRIDPAEATGLIMRYGEQEASLGFDLMCGNRPVSASLPLGKEQADSFTAEYARIAGSINASIRRSEDPSAAVITLSKLLHNLLLPAELEQAVRAEGIASLRLILDEELCGIPWEIPLEREYGISLPVRRILRSARPASAAAHSGGSILLIEGSSEGISTFAQEKNALLAHIQGRSALSAATIKAESAADLSVRLCASAGDARIVIFFGHSAHDRNGESGWICRDGSVFGAQMLRCIAKNPPEIIVSNSCESARAVPFCGGSFARGALSAGCRAYIGTHWELELKRSLLFLTEFIDGVCGREKSYFSAFGGALAELSKEYGSEDISRYNYVYYGE